MVAINGSINGLPPGRIINTQRVSKAKKNQVSHSSSSAASTSKVAEAVAHSIRQIDSADLHRAQLHYDLPEGRARKAMEEYLDIMNHAKKEELTQMLGVDLYI